MLLTRPVSNPASDAAREHTWGFESLTALLSFGALLGLLILAPFELSGFWATTYDFWPQALFLLLGAGATLLLAISPDARPHLNATGVFLIAFLGWNALSTFTSSYRHDAFLELARLLGAFTVFFTTRALWKPERALWIVGAWVLGMTWICGPALWDFAQTRYPRQAGPFFNTNLFANALAMTLPIALVFPICLARFSKNRAVLKLGAAPFLICALGLIVTSSKGGFLAAILAIFVTSILVFRAKSAPIRVFARRNRAILGVGTLVFLLIFGVIGAKTILPRLQNARGSDDNSTMFRAYIWRSTLDMATQKPLLGFGPGAFPHVYPRFARVGYTRSAHQSWLQVAAEGGFPALILLLGAVASALKSGWSRLKTRDWPHIAGATGAVFALLAHGCVDSGFQTTSIVILLAVALAILTAGETAQSEIKPAKSRLNLFWIGATLLLAWGGNQTQKAASGENARFSADQFLRNGAPSVAAQKMAEAVTLDSTSARLWSNLGRFQESSGIDGRAALQTAARLQPTRGSNWANLARAAIRSGGSPAEIEGFYDRALQNDPLNTAILLERAIFRLDSKNSAGYADLEKIISLRTQPLGLYAPVEQNVNLDFARATARLVPELRRTRQIARGQKLIESALADCNRARTFVALNEQTRRETGGEFGLNDNDDLETLISSLQALKIAG